jgi:hypothetical protein
MQKRNLRDMEVSEIGMGCMGFLTATGRFPAKKPIRGFIIVFYHNHEKPPALLRGPGLY